MSAKQKESLADRIKRIAIESNNNLGTIASIPRSREDRKAKLELEMKMATARAQKIIDEYHIIPKIIDFIECTSNVYKNKIRHWLISFEPGVLNLSVESEGKTVIIGIDRIGDYKTQYISPMPVGRIHEIDVIEGHWTIKCLINELINRFEKLGLNVYRGSNGKSLYIRNAFKVDSVGEHTFNACNINKIGEILKFQIREEDPTKEDVIKATKENTVQLINVVSDQLEVAAKLGAKHLRITYNKKSDSLEFFTTGTPYGINNKVIKTMLLDYFTYTFEYQKPEVITQMFYEWIRYFSEKDMGFKVFWADTENRGIIIKLFTKRDIKNGK